jgi:hypothetical protein
MPDDNADLANVRVEFPRLTPDGPDACPVPVADLLAYLADEVPDGDSLTRGDLTFVRTARVADAEYWVWRFREPGPRGEDAFATVSRSGRQVTLGYGTDYYGLSPEQFVLGDYHQVF